MRVSFYFAYGSNLDQAQMRIRCPESLVICEARLKGYRLDFTRYSSGWNCGVADIVRDQETEVWGVIYKITDSDFEALDEYEGYPDVYTRFQATIETPSGPLQGIWAYTVRNKQPFIPPSNEYLSIIKQAALQYHFPAHYQESLERIPLKGSSV